MNEEYKNLDYEDLEQKWRELPFSNDFIFCKVMEDPELCKKALELLLGFEIEHIEYPQAQRQIKNAADTRGIRLDIYTKSDGRRYDLEMQSVSSADLLKRARYYTGCIDVDTLKPGHYFEELNDVYIIFLCLEDPFKKGLPLYTYQSKCLEVPELPNDRTVKLFYNVNEYEQLKNPALKKFLEFIKTNIPADDFTAKLAQKTEEAKQNEEYRMGFMTLELREIQKYREGVSAGIEQKTTEATISLNSNGVSIPVIANSLNISEDKVREIIANSNK